MQQLTEEQLEDGRSQERGEGLVSTPESAARQIDISSALTLAHLRAQQVGDAAIVAYWTCNGSATHTYAYQMGLVRDAFAALSHVMADLNDADAFNVVPPEVEAA